MVPLGSLRGPLGICLRRLVKNQKKRKEKPINLEKSQGVNSKEGKKKIGIKKGQNKSYKKPGCL